MITASVFLKVCFLNEIKLCENWKNPGRTDIVSEVVKKFRGDAQMSPIRGGGCATQLPIEKVDFFQTTYSACPDKPLFLKQFFMYCQSYLSSLSTGSTEIYINKEKKGFLLSLKGIEREREVRA